MVEVNLIGKLHPKRYDGKFYRMDKSIMTIYGALPGFNSNVKLLYMALRDHAANNPERKCWPTQYSLEFDIGVSSKTISRATEVLVQYNLIKVEQNGSGKNYTYTVYDPLSLDDFRNKYPSIWEKITKKYTTIENRRRDDLSRLEEVADKSSD